MKYRITVEFEFESDELTAEDLHEHTEQLLQESVSRWVGDGGLSVGNEGFELSEYTIEVDEVVENYGYEIPTWKEALIEYHKGRRIRRQVAVYGPAQEPNYLYSGTELVWLAREEEEYGLGGRIEDAESRCAPLAVFREYRH